MRIVNLALAGSGGMGRRLLGLLARQREAVLHRYGVDFRVTACADSSGYVYDKAGLPIAALEAYKASGARFSQAKERFGRSLSAKAENAGRFLQADEERNAFLFASRADILVDLLPTDPVRGEPGLGLCAEAISLGMDVVFCDKGPLALKLPELESLAMERGVGLAYSAACGGGLPILSLGRRDLAGTKIVLIEGVLNHTSNIILSRMSDGLSWDEAWVEAMSQGHSEGDPRLDISGLDAAAKLCIVANAVLGQKTRLPEIPCGGIAGIDDERLRSARREGRELKLIARARFDGNAYQCSVAPEELAADNPLSRLGAGMTGALFRTEAGDSFFAQVETKDSLPAARLVMADLIDLVRSGPA